MYVELDLPSPPDMREVTSEYWSRYLFVGSPSQLYQVNALTTTFMRMAEAAVEEYKLGALALQRFWAPDRTALELSSMHRAIFHFESTLSAIHRAIDTYRRLRSHNAEDSLIRHVQALKPSFVSDRVANRFREARDVVQHLSEMVMKGQVIEGHPVALKPEGPEVPHQSEPGQTVKTYDRIVIGPHELRFREVVETLEELAAAATHIAQFDRRNPPARGDA
jgi:hypothetical protein